MNKEEFIKELEKVTGLDNNKCIILNSILDDHFIIGKNNKEKIVSDIKNKLDVTEKEAQKLYESVMHIIGQGIKDKLKHPFKSQD